MIKKRNLFKHRIFDRYGKENVMENKLTTKNLKQIISGLSEPIELRVNGEEVKKVSIEIVDNIYVVNFESK
jgi:hypothetical protein